MELVHVCHKHRTQVSSSTPVGRAAPPMRKMRGWPPKPTAMGEDRFHDAAARSLPTKIVHHYLADQEVCEPDGVDGQITSAKPSVHQPRIQNAVFRVRHHFQ